MTWLRVLLAVAAFGAPDASTPAARAEQPVRDVTLVVPNEPGGGIDLVARTLAPRLAVALGKNVIVVNRSGASGTIGTVSVANSDPDGRVLLVTGVGHLVGPMLHASAPYDALRDFEPVARIASAPTVLVVHESLRGLTLAQILSDPRSANGQFAYASAGYGHSSHLAAEAVMAKTGARWLHVPFRGTGPGMRALAAGDVQLMLMPAGSVRSALATGRTDAVAVAHERRLEALPGVPTFAESGLQGAEFFQWYGILAPRGTPARVADRLHDAIAAARSDGTVVERLRSLGLEMAGDGRAEFASFLLREDSRLREFVHREGVERPAAAGAPRR
jgi:tripartite-type tricarboxylate transporter receptor subunit TctC